MGFLDAFKGKTGYERDSVTSDSSSTTQRIFTQEAIDKTIYDILSSAQGLGSLADSENLTGSSNSSTKTLMSQDLFAKVAGTIAQITAPEVTNTTKKDVKKSGKIGTVICTELVRQGKMPRELYDAGVHHFNSLHPYTVAGYQVWANRVVPLMQRSERLSNALLPIALKRYNYTVHKKFSVVGWVSVHIAQPICFVIGAVLAKREAQNGHWA